MGGGGGREVVFTFFSQKNSSGYGEGEAGDSVLFYLIFKAMFLPAIFFDLGIDVLHEGIPLHQHVCEGGAGEDPHHLSGDWLNHYHVTFIGKFSASPYCQRTWR
jgi:hypothetical protein